MHQSDTASQPDTVEPDGNHPAQRVLLVDDEERLRGVLARFLRRRGHEVTEAATAADARSVLAQAPVDVLLLDINLVDETGWDVLRWLEAHPHVRRPCVVILSAVPPVAKRLEQFEPDAVLSKPFPIDALARLVEIECRKEERGDVEDE